MMSVGRLKVWRCPQPERAREIGCLDIEDNDQCTRKAWSSKSYFKEPDSKIPARAEVYCERIKTTLHEE